MNETRNKLIRVALYIRVSTDKQAKEGDSLEAQEQALVDYSKTNNMIIVDKYIDGGESGQKLNRTNLQRLLNDVKSNKIDLIIMTKLDRWFRSVSDFYKVNEILQKHKVRWKTIWEEYDTTTASGEFWLNMSLSMARMEAKRTGERIEAIFDHKYKIQKTVCTGNVPYGYKISKDKKLIIDKEKAKHIKLLYERYLKTNNLIDSVRWFQYNFSKKSYSSIKSYLKNTTYIGKFIRKKTGEVINDYAPRIISDELFYKVQDMLSKNLKNTTSKYINKPYIFTGLLKCPKCNNNLSGNSNHQKNIRYYRCKKGAEGILCSNKKNISEKNIEKFIITYLEQKLKNEILKIQKINSIILPQENKMNIYKNKQNKLVELYVNNLIDIEYYKKEYDKIHSLILTEENKRIETKKVDTTSLEKLLENDIISIYNKLDNLDKRKLLMSILDYIIVFDKDNMELEIKKHFFDTH